MSLFHKSISFIFHPLIMPLIAVVFYFSKTPRFFPDELVEAKVISLFILTVLLPILVYFLLKTLGKTKSIHLKTPEERKLPLAINAGIILMIILRVFPSDQIVELNYFFIGVLISTITCLALTFWDFKASIHMIAVCGVFMFFVALSAHFSKNINGSLALMVLIIGAVATSRLYLKAHTYRELIFGAIIGLLPQLVLINYWM